MNKGSAIFMVIGFLGLVLYGYVTTTSERRYSDEYFKKLNLNLTGIVTDVQTYASGNGMIYVDIRNSNIKDYDIRNKGGYYFCVIHNGMADIIEGTSNVSIGDSLVIDSNKMRFNIFHMGKLIIDRKLHLNQFDLSFLHIIKLHRSEFNQSRYYPPS